MPRFSSLPTALALILINALFTAALQSSPGPSPKASTNLICHTSDPAECYPAVFSPTKKFEVVHDDQSIPPGLHVRMNLATGLKEARLNVPESDEGGPADVVIIENSPLGREEDIQSSQPGDEQGGLLVQDQAGSYDLYRNNDEIAPPPRDAISTADEPDAVDLASKILSISPLMEPRKFLDDLSTLTDLAHDFEWGLALMQYEAFSKHMVQLIPPYRSKLDTEIRSAAALLLGTALQNNYRALQNFLKHPLGADEVDPVTVAMSGLEQCAEIGDVGPEDVVYMKRVVFLLSQLCQDEKQLNKFVALDGLQLLLKIYNDGRLINVDGGGKLSAKIKNFMDDHNEATRLHTSLDLLQGACNAGEC
ncbi:MAG: hypothetical protein Q9163_002057 [Psora crenata]